MIHPLKKVLLMTTSVSVLFFDVLAICCFFGPTKSEISVLPTKVTTTFETRDFLVMCRTPLHRMNWYIIFRTSNELERVHLFLASNEQTLNIKPNRAFTRFTELIFELTQTSFFWTSNKLKRVHLLVIEHRTFAFKRLNCQHSSAHH